MTITSENIFRFSLELHDTLNTQKHRYYILDQMLLLFCFFYETVSFLVENILNLNLVILVFHVFTHILRF